MMGIAVASIPHSISGWTNFIGAAKIAGQGEYVRRGLGKMVNGDWGVGTGES